MERINVAIIFGGKSAEHEVSLQSAKNVYDALDKKKYNPILIGIDKSGKWLLVKESGFLINQGDPRLIKLNQSTDIVSITPDSNIIASEKQIDVAFPILHGHFGEDGTVQGLLKLANIPFVGAGVLGSAVGMDKDVMKRLLRDAGLPLARFITLREDEPVPSFSSVVEKINLPFFVKPANMGSSVGISKVHNEAEYSAALAQAFVFDLKILLEEFIPGREIECSVLGNSNPKASLPGEVISQHEFYSYEAKYIDEKGAVLEIPAKLSPEQVKRVQDLAVRVFKTLACEGLGRVDFFLKENGDFIVNEINTIPGFTKISMYPKLWEASGIPYSQLIDQLLQLALERYGKEKGLKTAYL